MKYLALLALSCLPLAAERAKWIWDESSQENEVVAFRKSFEITDVVAASLSATCDNQLKVWINGKEVGDSEDWQTPFEGDVRKFLKPGKNLIAVAGKNDDGSAAMALDLEVTTKNGRKQILSDKTWQVSSKLGQGWNQGDFKEDGWTDATVVATMGDAPWGDLFISSDMTAQTPTDETQSFTAPANFKVEKLMDVPKNYGSWVSMAMREDGSFIVCDQYGGLFNVIPPKLGDPDASIQVEKIDVPIGGAHGLLWFQDALYVSCNEGQMDKKNGVYKVTDSDDDGKLDKVTELRTFTGGGEHGLHSLVLSPDSQWIYFIAGNHTDVQEMDFSWSPTNWKEDHLLPRNPDPRGHARERMAPGGFIARFKPDNSRWELVCNGFRNAFDMAFDTEGELFAYDADMEWDFGAPWYRPTRLNQAVPGAEFGWRNGTGKWPDYYEDSLTSVVNIGPGSPTAVISGKGAKFPAKYQKAIFCFDWTYATIYAIHLKKDGETYIGDKEEFVTGEGWPLTDAIIGKDGAMYFATGGRRTAGAFWRISYTGSESTAAVPYSQKESFQYAKNDASTNDLWDQIGSADRVERTVARATLERRGVNEWKSLFTSESRPQAIITGSIALAHSDNSANKNLIVKKLGELKWDSLKKQERLGLLRAYGLTASRLDGFSNSQSKAIVAIFDDYFPSNDRDTDRELCRLLSYLHSPTIVEKTLREIAANKPDPMPDWAALTERNSSYGKDLKNTMANLPSAQNLHYAYCLRVVPGPWTPGQREQFFTWLNGETVKEAGLSYKGFIDQIKNDALENATSAEKKMVASMKLAAPPNPFANLPEVKGPGKNYEVADVVALIEGGLKDRDHENGAKMFRAALCAACHRFDGLGGAAGPDLTTVSGRFAAVDLAKAILEPSEEISDQFEFQLIEKKDGSSLVGKILDEKDEILIVATNAFDFGVKTEVRRDEIKSIGPSPVSPMPGALINRLNEDELKDLLSYMLQKK